MFNFEETVKFLREKEHDYKNRTIPCCKGSIELFYITQLTDKNALADCVLKPLILYCSSCTKPINAKMTTDSIIYATECVIETDAEKINESILSGMVVILFSTDTSQYLVVNLKK